MSEVWVEGAASGPVLGLARGQRAYVELTPLVEGAIANGNLLLVDQPSGGDTQGSAEQVASPESRDPAPAPSVDEQPDADADLDSPPPDTAAPVSDPPPRGSGRSTRGGSGGSAD